MKKLSVLMWLSAVLSAGCAGGAGEGGFEWPRCERIPAVSLAERAAYFDEVSRARHLGVDGLYRNIYLDADLQGAEKWLQSENTILWSGMYLASQAFRYAVTREPEAAENARTVLAGLGDLARVTGVGGLYGRSLYRPDVAYDHDGAGDPGWTDSPVLPGWRFRNDVSKDGYAGLMFGYAAAMEHFDDAAILSPRCASAWCRLATT